MAPNDQVAAAPVTVAPAITKEYNECTLQIRLTNGKTIKQIFKSSDKMRQVFEFVERERSDGVGPFNLMSSFPKKVFDHSNLDTQLSETDLVPRGQLILNKLT